MSPLDPRGAGLVTQSRNQPCGSHTPPSLHQHLSVPSRGCAGTKVTDGLEGER